MIKEFSSEIIFRLKENLPRIEKCLSLLTEDQVWQKPNGQTNSIGNLILHISGNIRQYGIDGLSKSKDNRIRNLEFNAFKTNNKQELFQLISGTIEDACAAIEHLTAKEFEDNYSIQGFNLNGISVAVHITEHLSYHVGQIAFTTKLITNKDLGFYANIDLSITD